MLHCACALDHADLLQALVQLGASVNLNASQGSTPLHIACAKGHTSCAQLLLQAHASVEAETSSGERGLSLAFQSGAFECASLLMRAGAAVAVTARGANGVLGNTLHAAASYGWSECVGVLLEIPRCTPPW